MLRVYGPGRSWHGRGCAWRRACVRPHCWGDGFPEDRLSLFREVRTIVRPSVCMSQESEAVCYLMEAADLGDAGRAPDGPCAV